MLCQLKQVGDLLKCEVCGRKLRRLLGIDPGTIRVQCGAEPTRERSSVATPPVEGWPKWWPVDPTTGERIQRYDATWANVPCRHRGENTIRTANCELCTETHVVYEVRACAKHGECSLVDRTVGGKLRDCFHCADREAAQPAKLVQLDMTPPKPKRSGPVRVSFITPTMGMGGAERWILALCKAWSGGTDVAVKCIALTSGGQSWEPFCREAVRTGVPVYGSTELHPSQPNAAAFVERFDDAKEPLRRATTEVDVVLHWGIHRIGDLLRSVGYYGPSVSVSHGSLAATRPLLEAAASGSTHFAAVSQKAAEAYPEHLWLRVETLWNGCEVDRIVPTRSRDLVRAEWGCDPSDLLIGHVGRLAFDKNPLAVAHAAVAVQARMPDRRVRPVWVGNGWQATEVRREAVAIAGDACVWVDPPTHLGDAWGALDAYVLASPAEGFALALCEALLCGVPTVATPVGCVPEIEARFGQVVVPVPVAPTGDQLADAIEVALSSEHRPNVKRARQIVWEHFTGAAMARRWTEFLRKVAS